MEIARRQIIHVPLFKHAPKKVDGLVEGVQGIGRIEFGPQGVKNLVAGARQVGLREEKTEQRENLASDRRPLYETFASLYGNPDLVLDNDAIRELPGESPSEGRCTGQFSLSMSVRTKPCNVRLVADRLQEPSREETIARLSRCDSIPKDVPPSAGMEARRFFDDAPC
jgi:hypothetical protein